jgi:hypothetical protein
VKVSITINILGCSANLLLNKVINMSELSQKGENIYQTKILPNLPVDKLNGKIVAIETESEDYFIE